MNQVILILVGSQILFTISDLIGRTYMMRHGFTTAAFIAPWFIIYFLIRNIAMIGQLFVFSRLELGSTMALFGATSIIIANVLGFLVLRESLSPVVYIGVVLAVVAFIIIAFQSAPSA